MAQLKSTSVAGNLSVTGNVVASQFIKNDGTSDDILLGDGSTQHILQLNDNVNENSIKDPQQQAGSPNDYLYINPILTGLTLENKQTNELSAQRRPLEDLGINLSYDFKGPVTGASFRILQNGNVGDVYYITTPYTTTINGVSTTILTAGNWVCHTSFTGPITNFNTNYFLYWTKWDDYINKKGYLSRSGGRLTGPLLWNNITNTTEPILKIGATNTSGTTVLRLTYPINSSAPENKGQYGYSLIYQGGTGPDNSLCVNCDNFAEYTQVTGWKINQYGKMGIGMSPDPSPDGHQLKINGSVFINTNNSTLLTALNGTVLSMDSLNNLTVQNSNQINFLTSTNSKTTVYDVNGDWTMPSNLIVGTGSITLNNSSSTADPQVIFSRNNNCNWKTITSDTAFKIQNNTAAGSAYQDIITIDYSDSTIITKGSILPATSGSDQLGSGLYKWNAIFCNNLSNRIDLSVEGAASMQENIALNAHYGLNWTNATWTAQGDIDLTPNQTGSEWSFDIDDTNSSYPNAMWHIWSNKKGASLLQCIADPAYKVNIPQGKLGLGSANFIYNTDDKCIDVTFT